MQNGQEKAYTFIYVYTLVVLLSKKKGAFSTLHDDVNAHRNLSGLKAKADVVPLNITQVWADSLPANLDGCYTPNGRV